MSNLDFMNDLEPSDEQALNIASDKKSAGRPVGSIKPDDMKKSVAVPFKVSPLEAQNIDKALLKSGCATRSQFCRKAVNDLLDKLGVY